MSQLFKNNATSRLTTALGAADLSFTVATGEGADFPSTTPTDANHFLVTLENAAGDKEIVKIIGRSADVFTIDPAGRNWESSGAKAFSAGDLVELRLTSGFIDALKAGSIVYVIDGGGATITAGIKGFIEVPFSGSLEEIRLFADQPAGDISIDILKDVYANFPPDDTWDKMGNPVTISGTNKSQDDLSGWPDITHRMFNAGDIFAFDVNSCTTHQRVTISMTVNRN